MSRPGKIILSIAIGLVALVAIVVTAAFVVARTAWFQNFAKEKIIAATEDATGGRVEIGSFHFDPARLRAVAILWFTATNRREPRLTCAHAASKWMLGFLRL